MAKISACTFVPRPAGTALCSHQAAWPIQGPPSCTDTPSSDSRASDLIFVHQNARPTSDQGAHRRGHHRIWRLVYADQELGGTSSPTPSCSIAHPRQTSITPLLMGSMPPRKASNLSLPPRRPSSYPSSRHHNSSETGFLPRMIPRMTGRTVPDHLQTPINPVPAPDKTALPHPQVNRDSDNVAERQPE